MTYHCGDELRTVYAAATAGGYGFIASNITHPDTMIGLLNGAEAVCSEIVLQIKRDTAAYVGNGDVCAGFQSMVEHLRAVADALDVGVFLNVDHVDSDDHELLDFAIESPLPSSIMIDASDRPFEENVERTAAVVDRIADRDLPILVEAELGTIAGTESGVTTETAMYTEPKEAVEFVERTKCDLLAVSIGTEHGVSKGLDLDLRIDRAAEIHAALEDRGLEVPLVVHGSSGLTPEQVSSLMKTGVCKLNTNTRYQYEYARTACEFYREHADAIVPPKGIADDRTTFFAGSRWSPEKSTFNPQVVGTEIRERIADVYGELAKISGSAGKSRYA
ncbi:MAG: class II fructose-bisphosphate aldolase [Natronomonas sp.]|jgi:fructose-bisphosphate aldolase class II|uniref:class II fructose-bisphosphate aldolase n=1 Tax=Natronomonas sp. TaxID=2184060 RepID=UPI00287016F8|nr:class II fructose-bisphosphate aldolase [Natronomonas sp.]MDR9429425.1 class II fructose-bisphosphate aldolase [Natronomonas sp.]